MRVFCEVAGLLELECAGQWGAARDLLHHNWIKQKENLDWLCRLMTECWLVLSEWCYFDREKNSEYFRFKKTLIEVTQYGLHEFKDNSKFLWLAGYMIHMFPNYFSCKNNDTNFLKWEQLGKEMLCRAVQLDPSNLIALTLYRGTQSTSAAYLDAKNALNTYLDDLFPGKTAVEKYFRAILS